MAAIQITSLNVTLLKNTLFDTSLYVLQLNSIYLVGFYRLGCRNSNRHLLEVIFIPAERQPVESGVLNGGEGH